MGEGRDCKGGGGRLTSQLRLSGRCRRARGLHGGGAALTTCRAGRCGRRARDRARVGLGGGGKWLGGGGKWLGGGGGRKVTRGAVVYEEGAEREVERGAPLAEAEGEAWQLFGRVRPLAKVAHRQVLPPAPRPAAP